MVHKRNTSIMEEIRRENEKKYDVVFSDWSKKDIFCAKIFLEEEGYKPVMKKERFGLWSLEVQNKNHDSANEKVMELVNNGKLFKEYKKKCMERHSSEFPWIK